MAYLIPIVFLSSVLIHGSWTQKLFHLFLGKKRNKTFSVDFHILLLILCSFYVTVSIQADVDALTWSILTAQTCCRDSFEVEGLNSRRALLTIECLTSDRIKLPWQLCPADLRGPP